MRRHQRIEQAYFEALAQLPEPLMPSPEAQAMMLETLVEIDRLLDGLSLQVRQAFLITEEASPRMAMQLSWRLGLPIHPVPRCKSFRLAVGL